MAEDPLASARGALDRGEYGLVLRLLDPLAAEHPAPTPLGGAIRLLMATALMGQGRGDQAAACCRELQRCLDPELRAQARDLLLVLEAPALRRPREWSLTLPDLATDVSLEGIGAARPASRPAPRQEPESPPPPVGPTRAPLGFAALALVLLVLVLIASLLGGCLQVRSDLRFEGPGRLQVRHSIGSAAGPVSPWQRRFASELEAAGFRRLPHQDTLVLTTPVLPAAQALAALQDTVATAARLSELPLAAPQLRIEERNWLVGVRQHLDLAIDLRAVPALAGLDLRLDLEPLDPAAVRCALPLPARRAPHQDTQRAVEWPLQPGALNHLEARTWRWSPIGLGGGAIALALILVLGLQRIRRQLGFGLPELPA